MRGVPAGDFLARILDDPREWSLLDDLDPDQAADLAEPPDPAAAGADPDPVQLAADAKRRRALELDGFTRSLVQGVADHRAELDELIQTYARRWTVARMPAIDRSVLRLGTYELAFETTSPAVVINEVIELAKSLSTEDSGRYVNGVLESVRKHLADTPLQSTTSEAANEVEVIELLDAEPVDEGSAPLDDVLPPPDDEGEAVDLLVDPEPADTDEPDAADGELADDAAADDAENADDAEGADDGPGDAQPQLF